MIVIDASIAVAYLVRTTASEAFFEEIASVDRIAAPTLIRYEIGSALRRLCLAGKLSEPRANMALRAIADFSIELYDADILLPRMWDLRDNFSFYDAAYVALAETLDLPLYTADRRLALTPGHKAQIVCF